MSVIKVENLIKNYKKSTWKESEEDGKSVKRNFVSGRAG